MKLPTPHRLISTKASFDPKPAVPANHPPGQAASAVLLNHPGPGKPTQESR